MTLKVSQNLILALLIQRISTGNWIVSNIEFKFIFKWSTNPPLVFIEHQLLNHPNRKCISVMVVISNASNRLKCWYIWIIVRQVIKFVHFAIVNMKTYVNSSEWFSTEASLITRHLMSRNVVRFVETLIQSLYSF